MKKTVHTTLRAGAMIGLAGLLGACASYDRQDEFVLGEATRQNIAQQAVRDVNLSNSRAVEESSGVRAVKAVKSLNERRTDQSASASSQGGSIQ